MPMTDPAAFRAALKPGSRLIGIDLGAKNVGLALSDAMLVVASPLETMPRGRLKDDVATLRERLTRYDVGGIVIGLPRNMDGSEGPAAQAARAYARNLERELGVPVTMWDERLSTTAVERTLLDADMSRRRRGEVIDKMAASFILQGFLDRLAHIARS
ncbi:MAG TPA: Holliday junction resolvase RuvX [Micropepsaceae bacterium]|nr:Holliday junction resolvase RuvX [Micropepsaceae bacterium]